MGATGAATAGGSTATGSSAGDSASTGTSSSIGSASMVSTVVVSNAAVSNVAVSIGVFSAATVKAHATSGSTTGCGEVSGAAMTTGGGGSSLRSIWSARISSRATEESSSVVCTVTSGSAGDSRPVPCPQNRPRGHPT
jgi:hypothetical protein